MAGIDRSAQIARLAAALPTLSDSVLLRIEGLVAQMGKPHVFWRLPASDLVDDRFLADFGDVLRIHHTNSDESFSKDKFEHAIQFVATACGRSATLARKGNRGHDVTIDGVPISLKTQADQAIKENEIHVSKFMELGKGQWGRDVADLAGLRAQFFVHMASYERIFTLRYLGRAAADHRYELVEIPKALFARAAEGQLVMSEKSTAECRPGFCYVRDAAGELLFQLYFDGAGERKLQIQKLKKSLCTVHADWRFAR